MFDAIQAQNEKDIHRTNSLGQRQEIHWEVPKTKADECNRPLIPATSDLIVLLPPGRQVCIVMLSKKTISLTSSVWQFTVI